MTGDAPRRSGWGRWALFRQVRWAGPLLAIVLAGLVVLAVNAYRIGAQLDALQTAQTDNMTWLVTQLEVEVLKLDAAVGAALDPGGPGAEEDLRRAYDLYLSRIGVIAGSLEGGPLADLRRSADWHEILNRSATLQRTFDQPSAELQAALPWIAAQMPDLRRAVRLFSVTSLSRIVDSAAEDRALLRALLNRSTAVSIMLIGLSLALGAMMFRLALQLRHRGRTEAQARANLERTLAASLDGVITAGPDGRIQSCNPAAAAMFGRDGAAMVGLRLASVLLPGGVADAAAARLDQALRAGLAPGPLPPPPEGRIEVTSARSDGSAFPLEVALATDPGSDGLPALFVFLRDISEQRSFETSLRDARDAALAAAEAKARFLALMSHEMRTPLNGLIAALEILRRTTPLSPRQDRFLGVAEGAATLAVDQINEVLELVRLDGPGMAEETVCFDLAALIRDVAGQTAPLAARQGNRLVLDLPPGEPEVWVLGMKRLLLRVLMNLAGNAAKFTRDGQITLAARLQPGPDAALQAVITVADTGIGIPEDKFDRIFDPFERLDTGYDRAAEGTGLGLGIARRAVDLMGGQIAVQSTPGKGSVFTVTLPLTRSAAPEPAPAALALPDPALPRRSVLVVEDNLTNRIVLREMLQELGQQVTMAEDGHRAVALAATQAFDLILMDISMPGMDGLAATRAIRSGSGPSAQTRIVGLTAHGAPEDLQHFARAGLPEVMVKPLTFALLQRLLQDAGPAAAVDDTTLADLRALLPDYARATALAAFLAEGDGFLAALGAQPPADLAALAHRLHGSCSLFGGVALGAALQRLETALQDDPAPVAAEEQARIAALWQDLRAKVVLALGN